MRETSPLKGAGEVLVFAATIATHATTAHHVSKHVVHIPAAKLQRIPTQGLRTA